MLAVRDGAGALQTIAGVRVRDESGVLRTVQSIRIRDEAGALRTVFSALGASVNPFSVDGFGDSPSPIAIQTQPVTAAAQGGTAPFTFAWTQASGDPATILNPTGAQTAFRFASVGPGDSRGASFVCTITDATGASAQPSTVFASATNYGNLGGGGGPLP